MYSDSSNQFSALTPKPFVSVMKLKINYRLKNKTWTNAQIKNHKKSHELGLIRPQTQHKIPEHKYLKFLTPSVETTVNLHGFH
jgi:hypothetical protein